MLPAYRQAGSLGIISKLELGSLGYNESKLSLYLSLPSIKKEGKNPSLNKCLRRKNNGRVLMLSKAGIERMHKCIERMLRAMAKVFVNNPVFTA